MTRGIAECKRNRTRCPRRRQTTGLTSDTNPLILIKYQVIKLVREMGPSPVFNISPTLQMDVPAERACRRPTLGSLSIDRKVFILSGARFNTSAQREDREARDHQYIRLNPFLFKKLRQ